MEPAIGGFAADKAYTTAILRQAAADFGERMAANPTLALGVGTREWLMTWRGGVPVFEEADCIGAVGVSGAKDSEDIECTAKAIEDAGLSFR